MKRVPLSPCCGRGTDSHGSASRGRGGSLRAAIRKRRSPPSGRAGIPAAGRILGRGSPGRSNLLVHTRSQASSSTAAISFRVSLSMAGRSRRQRPSRSPAASAETSWSGPEPSISPARLGDQLGPFHPPALLVGGAVALLHAHVEERRARHPRRRHGGDPRVATLPDRGRVGERAAARPSPRPRRSAPRRGWRGSSRAADRSPRSSHGRCARIAPCRSARLLQVARREMLHGGLGSTLPVEVGLAPAGGDELLETSSCQAPR